MVNETILMTRGRNYQRLGSRISLVKWCPTFKNIRHQCGDRSFFVATLIDTLRQSTGRIFLISYSWQCQEVNKPNYSTNFEFKKLCLLPHVANGDKAGHRCSSTWHSASNNQLWQLLTWNRGFQKYCKIELKSFLQRYKSL